MKIDTVKENLKFFNNRQVAEAKAARELMHEFGCTPEKLKQVSRQRLILDNPVTPEHVDRAEKIWGKDVAMLKGKSTRKQPKAVVDDTIEVPEELYANNGTINLEIDVMFINQLPMLTGIDTTVKNRNFEALKCETVPELRRALDTFLREYNKAGFRIGRIDCDNQFGPMFEEMEDDWEIELNLANPNDHVPAAERNNRTLKERIRTILHRLPFKYFPRLILRKAGEKATKALNMFPAAGGVSNYYSPYAIMTNKNVNYRDLKIPFGSYVQAYEESQPHNSNKARALDCIYLQPAPNRQEGHRSSNELVNPC